MAALSVTSANEYVIISDDHEQLQRPKTSEAINGAALFFSLIVKLEIPLLGRSYNPWVQDDALQAGLGASFAVSRLVLPFSPLISRLASAGQHTDEDVGFGVGPPRDVNHRIGKSGWYASKRIASRGLPDGANDAQALSPLVNELRILSQKSIKECHSIIDLFYVAWDELPDQHGRFWPRLIIENAQWGTLSDMLQEQKMGRDYDVLMNWAKGIMEGLAALHAIGVAHCDLKPDNILMITGNEKHDDGGVSFVVEPKISDFGFSVIIGDYNDGDVFERQMGTKYWNSPELALPEEVPVKLLPKSDIYSFGLLFAQLFLGAEPLFGSMTSGEVLDAQRARGSENMVEHIVRTNISNSSILPADAQSIFNILFICLSVLPQERYSARDLLPRLAALTDVSITLGRPASTTNVPVGESTNLNQALIGLDAGALGRGDRHAVPQLRISGAVSSAATFENFVAESHIGIPEFEFSYNSFDPFNIPDGALRAIISNLRYITTDENQSLENTKAEASYELGILHCRGIEVGRDIDTGLRWISQAITLGSNVAQRGGLNIFSSYERTMPIDSQALIRERLPQHARDELVYENELLFGTYQTEYPFPAASFLKRECPEDYGLILRDLPIHRASGLLFMINNKFQDHSRSMIPSQSIETVLDSIELAMSWLEDPLVLAFIYDERAIFPDMTFLGPFTALQCAILFGATELVRQMVKTFHADCREEGPTKFPPLWLASALGRFEIAQVLLEYGADICCIDGHGGKSILHLLSQFDSVQDIHHLLEQALLKGLDINILDEVGRTPLHATHIGWDYSDGSAAELLMKRGARLATTREGFTSIFLRSARDLDLPLMQSALARLESDPPSGTSGYKLSTELRASAFRRVMSFSEIYRRRLLGSDYRKLSLELAVDPRSPSRSCTVLTACAVTGCNDILEILLDESLVDIDGTDSEHRNALMLCLERRNLVGAEILLRRGSNPHLCNVYGSNCLQLAAERAPSMLMYVAAAALVHPARDRTKSDQEILHTSEVVTNTSGPPYVTALLHGNWEEAEQFRLAYDLRCERIIVRVHSTQEKRDFSMLGHLISLSLHYPAGLGLKAIKELLARCDDTDFIAERVSQLSILHWVTHRSEKDIHLNWYNRHEIMKQILKRFPEESYIHMKSKANGETALHKLVDANDWKGFAILDAHAKVNGFSLAINATDHGKGTPLNGIGKLRKALEDAGALSSTFDRQVWRSMVDDGLRLYRRLRSLGAAFSNELWGICIRFFYQNGNWLPRERLIAFGTKLANELNFRFEWIDSDDDLGPLSQTDITRVLELRWAYDQFIIRGLEFKYSSFLEYRKSYMAPMAADIEEHCGTRAPWVTTKYNKMKRKQLSWNRKGAVWKTKAVQELATKFQLECTRCILREN